MPNNDINKDKLLYVPKTELVRNYESKGQFQDAYIPIDDNEEQIVPNRLSISEDLVEVRDLIDSLYTGYPTGYLIISQSPNMKLKDGTLSEGKKIMIDGQQRVTALMTAIMGVEVINSDFEKKRIKISYYKPVETGVFGV